MCDHTSIIKNDILVNSRSSRVSLKVAVDVLDRWYKEAGPAAFLFFAGLSIMSLLVGTSLFGCESSPLFLRQYALYPGLHYGGTRVSQEFSSH